MKKMMKNEKGFTLIELIIVIAILAIIAAVAIPNILGAVDNSRKSTDVANAKIIANAAAQVIAKDENAAGAVFAAGTALDIGSVTADNSGTYSAEELAFTDKLFLELNSNPPLPKYKGGTIVEDDFYLVITTTNAVQVWVGNSGNTASGDLQLYPKPDATYNNN